MTVAPVAFLSDRLSITNKRVLESHKHESELQKVAAVRGQLGDVVHIGSTGVQALVWDTAGWKIANQIETTQDADVVMGQRSLQRVTARLRASQVEHSLIDSHKTHFLIEGVRERTVEVPFSLVRLSVGYEPLQNLFDNIDIFTHKTGVGPIPVTDEVFNLSQRVEFDDISIRAAAPFYLIATQVNPLALLPQRLYRLSFLMFESYGLNGEAAHSQDVHKAIEYIGMGSDRVAEKIAEHPAYDRIKAMGQYDQLVRKTPNMVQQQKGRLTRAAGMVGLSQPEAERALEIFKDLLASFRKNEPAEAEQRLAAVQRSA